MVKKLDAKKLKILNIGIGLLVILLSLLVMIFSVEAVIVILLIFIIILLGIGIARVSNALSNEKLANKGVILKYITGVFAMIIAFVLFVLFVIWTAAFITVLIYLLLIVLLVIGCSRLSIGLLTGEYLLWFRAILVIIGIISIMSAVIMFFIPRFDIQLALLLISISFLLNGIARLILGIIGTG